MRYVDLPAVDELESKIAEHTEKLSQQCVDFFVCVNPRCKPYEQRVKEQHASIDGIEKVTDARSLEEELSQGGTELENAD